MAFTDLRTFIDGAARIGELKVIDGAHWNLEIGCLTELMAEQEGPLLLFDKIVDYPARFSYRDQRVGDTAALRPGSRPTHRCAEAGDSQSLAQQDSRSQAFRPRRSFIWPDKRECSRR